MIRDLVLTLTMLAIICLLANRPPPSRMVQVDYCKLTKRVAGKEYLHTQDGEPVTDTSGRPVWRWKFEWGEMYSPCSQQDKFYNT